uniref:SKI/SNO/DAC domain-containing protein n=1 Tax=Parascaris univalens TaxID=6257 RepID=A0A915APW5_PARUN
MENVKDHSPQETMSRETKSCAMMDSMSSLHSAAEMHCRSDDERSPERIVTEQVLVRNSDLPQKLSDFDRDPYPSSVMSPQISVQLTHFDSAEPVTAKLYQYRGELVAGFEVFGRQMICLPQLYEIFLKSLVGGLHTVYTKLKRLEIHPLICSVEQVRALRSLGAIQPGVNRCKLISCDDFERLYQDCHSNCSRPGRPAKRCPSNNEWGGIGKKEKLEDKIFEPAARKAESETIAECDRGQQSGQTQLFLALLPFTAQQLLVQGMMASAAAIASQQQLQQHEQRQQLEHHKQCVTQRMRNVIRQ